MKKRRGTPSYNRIVTSVFAILLCASAAQADSRKTNSNSGALIKENNANVIANPLPAKTITGKVVDSKGEALPGVAVQEQGTTKGTQTDANGNYSLSVEGDNSVLVFTYLGFETQSVTVGARTVVNVTMATRTSALEEVVVTALGIKRESKKLGYAATSVKVDELTENRTTNVMTSLEGKVAGLNISPPSAGAGASNRVRLRGQSGFAGSNNSPLIVINGLPMDQGAQGAFQGGDGNNFDRGDAFQQINQDDIESMTVLKGATAAALYGSRAANGALVITTKSGSKNSKFGVDFTSSFAADQVLDYSRFQKEYGFGTAGKKPTTINEAVNGGGQTWGAKHDGSPAMFFDGVERPYVYSPNRIKDFYRTGTSFTNTIALSGGNSSTSYRASFSNQDVKGIVPNNDYHKKIFNVGINSKISEKLNFQFNVNYANEINNNPPQVALQGAGAPNFLQRMSSTIPLEVFRDAAVNPLSGSERQSSAFQGTLLNPYYSMPRQFRNINNDRILSTTTLRYDFFKFLYLQGRMSMDYSNNFSESNTPHGVGSNILQASATNTAFGGSYNVNTQTNRNMNYDFLLGTNNQKFGDFSAELTLGGNILDEDGRNFSETGTNFVIKDLYTIENSVTKDPQYNIGRQQVNSVYGVVDLGYKNFLYLSITDRVDWFSRLTSQPLAGAQNSKNSYNYPSVSASFVFSELLPNVSWLNYGKLRASYADVGSSAGIGNFAGALTYSIAANPFIIGSNSYSLANFGGTNPNRLLMPFGVSEKEVGLEVKTLGSRLNFDVAVYEKRTTGQIINVNLSNATGFTSTPQNLGKLRNRGIEIMVEGTPVKTANFSWNSSINAAYNESLVQALEPGKPTLLVQDFNGGQNEFLGKLMHYEGMAMNQLVAKTYVRDAQGRILLNANNGRLLDARQTSDVVFGSADPKWTGGWVNNFRYKKYSLLVHIDYKFGGKVFSSTALNGLRQGYTQASLVGREGGVRFDGVLANGDPSTVAANPQDFYSDYRTYQIADPFVFSGSFIKLRNITLSYDFSDLVKNAKFIKGISMSAFCRNVAILKKYIPDVDPEAFGSSGDTRLGYEQATLPTTRTFGLNLNVKF